MEQKEIHPPENPITKYKELEQQLSALEIEYFVWFIYLLHT